MMFRVARRNFDAASRALCLLLGGAAALLTSGIAEPVEAKGPGARYCFYGTCHRVKTLAETRALVGKEMRLVASYYDSCKKDRYNPCGLTSSGEVFHPDTPDNAASPILPDGTVVLVRNPANGQTAVVRINNAGPYWGNRKLDLSRAAAERLGFRHRGIAELEVRVVKAPTPAEARYRKGRRYDPVPGHIGRFASADEAHVAVAIAMAVEMPASVRVASLTGAASLLRSTGEDQHGLRAALKARIASLPLDTLVGTNDTDAVRPVMAAWSTASAAEPERKLAQVNVASAAVDRVVVAPSARDAQSLSVALAAEPRSHIALRAVEWEPAQAEPMAAGAVVLASLDSSEGLLAPSRMADPAATVSVPEASLAAAEASDLAAFALFVAEVEPQERLAETSRQVADWQWIDPRPSCVPASDRAAVAYVGVARIAPGRARVPEISELSA